MRALSMSLIETRRPPAPLRRMMRRVTAVAAVEWIRGLSRVGASASTVAEANAVVHARAGDWTDAQRQMALAIGRLESGFGVDGSWLLEDGTPSYNWGALTGSGTAGSLKHGDNEPDGTPVTYSFQAFHSMAEAFDAFRRTWTRSDVSADKAIPHEATVNDAAARGDAYAVARTMYAHRYYGGTPTGSGAWHPSMGSDDERRIQTYAKAIVGSAAEIARQIGEPLAVAYVGPGGAPSSSSAAGTVIGSLAIGGALGGAALYFGAPIVAAAGIVAVPLVIGIGIAASSTSGTENA